MSNRNQHVVPHGTTWAVRSEHAKRVASTHRTQREAIAEARATARRRGGELFVHSRTGRIRQKDSSGGHDPSPPRG